MAYATLRPGLVRIGKTEREDAEARSRAVEAATARFEPAIKKGLLQAFALLSTDIASARFLARLAEGDVDGAMETLSVAKAREVLVNTLGDAMFSSIRSGGRVVEALDTIDMTFEAEHFRIVRMAENHTYSLVQNIELDTRAMLRRVIREAVDEGLNPRVAAKGIRPLVGLLDKHATAVTTFHRNLLSTGVKRVKADEAAARYAGRLLKYRTEMIARTEMMWSANTTQVEYWRQLQHAGWIGTEAQMVWATTDDDRLCEQCAPMDGEVVETLYEPFTSSVLGLPGEELRPRPQGDVLIDHPPLHPMCRCILVLKR